MSLMELPLIDAARLYELRGAEVCAEVPLADGTVPIMDTWRMDAEEWRCYRAMCGVAVSLNRRALAEV